MSWISDVRTGLKRLPQDARSLRKFALVIAGAMLVLAALVFSFGAHPQRAYWLTATAAVWSAVGLPFPKLLKPLHTGWMAFALTIGWIMSRIFLTILFFLVITPIGLLMRIFGKALLQQKIEPERKSYWLKRDRSDGGNERYERQF